MKYRIFVFCIFALGVQSMSANASQENLVTREKRAWLDSLQQDLEKSYKKDVTLNQQGDGYYGIWYQCGKTPGEYIYKYSGGLGTYCAKHRPFAIYCKEVNKTFFCYGGAKPDNNQALIHMVSYYDHTTGMVPRPTILLDKKTSDAHDNPVISVDDNGYVWIFSTAHGTGRPSYIHKSRKPYSVDEFDLINANIKRYVDEDPIPFLNFSYFQVWNVPQKGFGFHDVVWSALRSEHVFCIDSRRCQLGYARLHRRDGQGSYQISFADETVLRRLSIITLPKRASISERMSTMSKAVISGRPGSMPPENCWTCLWSIPIIKLWFMTQKAFERASISRI
jgi:hypothetical protein